MRHRTTGTVASIGYAAGPLRILDTTRLAYHPSGDNVNESERLLDAMEAAAQQVEALAASADIDAAEILEFQSAMLRDASLSESALEEIIGGLDAATSWSDTMGVQIADYESADDAYFRARSADMKDIHDRVLRILTGERQEQLPPGVVIHAHDLTPSEFLSIDFRQGGGIVLSGGSAASHVAMLARARGVPMLVGVPLTVANDDYVLVDAEHGVVTVEPDAAAEAEFKRAASALRELLNRARAAIGEPAVTVDGAAIDVLVNIAEPSDTDSVDIETCDGVGLMRTEFLFSHGLPDEDSQLAAYRKVVGWAKGKPVTIRTVDAGGDKPVPGFTVDETNPFLGLRGIRLSLAKPDIFRIQIRALLRVAVEGNVKVMFPMISVAAEYRAALDLFRQASEELTTEGIPHTMPPLGIMVEVPAVAIHPAPFANVAFFSIGSNDLTQYVMAAGRDNGAVAALGDPLNPAVLGLVRNIASFGRDNRIPVSLCGDAGGDPRAIPSLIAAGLRSLSVTPAQLALAKATIAASRAGHAEG